jgi:hypothetical protein
MNTGPTFILGDLGTGGTFITGFPPGHYTGTESIAEQATALLNDAKAAYNALARLNGAIPLTGGLGA